MPPDPASSYPTAAELSSEIRSGRLTAVAAAQASAERIAALDGTVRAFLHTDAERSAAWAADADRRIAEGSQSDLAGIPVAIKDNLCIEGEPCTCASRMLENFRPPYTATAVRRLLDAGAVPIGRTNLDEFAMGSSTENSVAGPTRNPWDPVRAPGGSSGGSAAAVAAGMAPIALGSDTGGSIRQPAAFCGVVGLKPTYGRVSRYGLVAFASSLDQIGPFARTVRGAATVLQTIAGHDPLDSTSLSDPVPDYLTDLDEPLAGLRVGVVADHFDVGLDKEVADAVQGAIETYRSLGAEVVNVTLPHSKYSVATYYLIAPSEASSNLARYDGVHYGHRAKKFGSLEELYERSRGEGFGNEVKRRIMLGTYALSSGYYDAFYLKAMKVRRLIQQDYDAAFEQCDVIASPVTPTTAFAIGELADDPLAMYLSDVYTISANLAGIPALSLPCGFSKGLPIGLQLLGPALSEPKLLRAARMYEFTTDWHTRVPPLQDQTGVTP
ncbi:Asp-tRNA(Asn)/Glu-tRNA(Gln) amidotransferase subunit GatA [Alienimonas chondri]|uniref:Asp-tRNA(Asn)/Glu-tRNA(Gln) amidotransferase subunit GatA n=1 Tax=Alienimonas chondri TaxID=2681879 RepID=UPI0014891CE8|nr:Asp-tRNA(Asn)/Glu-tRNA(Gln) amidotransferase subunit GatA [Alienimonas chondri]